VSESSEIQELSAKLDVLYAAMNAAISTAEHQAVTNQELNMLHDELRSAKNTINLMRDIFKKIMNLHDDAGEKDERTAYKALAAEGLEL
jgi:predicted  nucleic acid-binding Zn-ribbon protein